MSATRERSPLAGPRNGCIGWEDDGGGYHKCATDDLPLLAKGRCTRCYSRHNAAERKVRREEEERSSKGALRAASPEPARLDPDVVVAHAALVADAVAVAPAAPEGDSPSPDAASYEWTLFDQPPHIAVATEPRISVVKDGNCRLNKLAYALYGREVEAVEILYDRRRGAIALRPCPADLPHARRLRPDKQARSVSLRAFQRATGILAGQSCVARPHMSGGMLVFAIVGGAA